jgi:hypothetical protein
MSQLLVKTPLFLYRDRVVTTKHEGVATVSLYTLKGEFVDKVNKALDLKPIGSLVQPQESDIADARPYQKCQSPNTL